VRKKSNEFVQRQVLREYPDRRGRTVGSLELGRCCRQSQNICTRSRPGECRRLSRNTDGPFAGRRRLISKAGSQTVRRATQRRSRTIHVARRKRSDYSRSSLHSAELQWNLEPRAALNISLLFSFGADV